MRRPPAIGLAHEMVHAWSAIKPDLAHLPGQPRPPRVGSRLADDADPHVQTLYVLVFIGHRRRALVHNNVTSNPTAAWVWRQLIEATPWGSKPRHVLRDHDAVYGRDFGQRAGRIGIDAIVTPVASPRANAVIERFIGTLRRECLDHLIILDEQHLRSVLTEFVGYYNLERPHRTLCLETPLPVYGPAEGSVQSRPVLGGLHHVYERAA